MYEVTLFLRKTVSVQVNSDEQLQEELAKFIASITPESITVTKALLPTKKVQVPTQKVSWEIELKRDVLEKVAQMESGEKSTCRVSLAGVPSDLCKDIGETVARELANKGFKATVKIGSDYRGSWAYVEAEMTGKHPIIDRFNVFGD